MELTETLETINEKLLKEYGREFNGWPKFRLVFSEDQYEKRWTQHSREGLELTYPEVRELPKYKQYIHEKYILERLVPVPEGSDLIEKISYEPAWVFMDKNGNYLPPRWDACQFIVEAIYAQMDKKGRFKTYTNTETSEERRIKEIAKMEEQLFGDETNIGDALTHGSGVTDFNQKTKLPTVEKSNLEVSNG